MLRADVPGNPAGVVTLVEIRLGKSHGEGAHSRQPGRKSGDEARVQSSREQQADRYVGDQMLRRHLGERGMELILKLARFRGSVTCSFWAEVALELRFIVRPHAHKVSWGQLMHAIEDSAVILEGVSEFQKLTDRAPIERRPKPRKRQQGLDFRREHNATTRWNPIVERLDAHRIPKQKQGTLCRAPNGEREHASDMPYALGTPGGECKQQNFGIRLRMEAIPLRLKMSPQFPEIVDLAVER